MSLSDTADSCRHYVLVRESFRPRDILSRRHYVPEHYVQWAFNPFPSEPARFSCSSALTPNHKLYHDCHCQVLADYLLPSDSLSLALTE